MKLEGSFPIEGSPETFRKYIADPQALAYVKDRHPEIAGLKALEHRQEGEKLFVKLEYNMDVPMPGPVKKALGGSHPFVVDLIIDTKTDAATLEILPSRLADKIKAGGRIYFEQKGGRWVQNMDGDVTVKMFGVGKLVEKFVVERFQKAFALETQLRNEFIRQQEKA